MVSLVLALRMIRTGWVAEFLLGQCISKDAIAELKDLGVPSSQICSQFLQNFEAGISSDSVVNILNMRINVFLELRDLEIMVPEKVGIHLNPIVPV